jgi:serine/threonine protein kinase
MLTLKENSSLQNGKYRILSVLGQGGFGITYLAVHTMLGARVAIKEFFPKDFCDRDNTTSHVVLGTSNTAELVEKLKIKFLKEARNIAKLHHPNIVSIQDIFEENNTAYYIMGYVEGSSLGDMIKFNGAVSESKAVKYIVEVCEAISYMHSMSMNHLDIKPGNIMIRAADDTPILIDFGTSKQYDSEGEQTSTMAPGFTHGYAPAEQYKPGGVSTFTPQTDIYALGATLYALLTGNKPPHYSEIMEDGIPPLPGSVSKTVAAAIAHAMQIRKNDRPATIDVFLSELSPSTIETNETTEFVPNVNGMDEDTCINNDKIDRKSPISIINGHEAMDIGLSVLWATKDIGASDEFKRGECYVWGDPNGSKTRKVQNSVVARWCLGGPSSNNISNDPRYDTARGLWGNGWRMPTIDEVKELIYSCEWLLLNNGTQAKLFGPNGSSIILDNRIHWTSESPRSNVQPFGWDIIDDRIALILPRTYGKNWSELYFPIRPVADKK